MRYIVCNSENAVFNRVYDELEKYIEDGAVFSFSEELLGTQFIKRITDEHNNGKYMYKHIIFVGQNEIIGIEKDEYFGFYRSMKKNFYSKLDIDYKNVFSPEYNSELDIEKYEKELDDNRIDVVILIMDDNGNVLNISDVIDNNKTVHIKELSVNDKSSLYKKLGVEHNEHKLISIGLDNIVNARNIFLVALGNNKKHHLQKLFEDTVDDSVLSLLKNHNNLTVFADKEASYKSEEEANKLIRDKKRKKEIEELRRFENEAKSSNK